ncbi:MAG: insulinase family protein [Bacteroidetes bacterium]|nr:insulinase family protein [Bacteroidota bacterium]
MVNFERFTLENGLRVIVHTDITTPLVSMNILYNVGSRDEDPEKTGFAHLFEHLMFGGSVNIKKYDEPLERVGGENNAFTNNDVTDYYLTVPKQNLESAFWLESDRMLNLAFSKKSLEVQRSVVIEEFRQNYLNQPFGDVWLLLRPMAYTTHPYRWSTIGKEIKHIQDASMEDVRDFYSRFYNPNNAILVLAGNTTVEEVKQLSEKWFTPIPAGPVFERNIPREPVQIASRSLTVQKDVPIDSIYKVYHMCGRMDSAYPATDLLSDVLSNGDSSRLYQSLLKEQQLFSEINAFLTGDEEGGLFVVTGKLIKGVEMEHAEDAILEQLDLIKQNLITDVELQKVKNKAESLMTFSEMRIQERALNLAYAEHLGDVDMVNNDILKYNAITPEQIRTVANEILQPQNCSTLYYYSKEVN